jgi:hypothetical protein
MILNLEKPAVRQAMTDPLSSYWLRASSEIHDAADGGRTQTAVSAGQDSAGEGTISHLLPGSGIQL